MVSARASFRMNFGGVPGYIDTLESKLRDEKKLEHETIKDVTTELKAMRRLVKKYPDLEYTSTHQHDDYGLVSHQATSDMKHFNQFVPDRKFVYAYKTIDKSAELHEIRSVPVQVLEKVGPNTADNLFHITERTGWEVDARDAGFSEKLIKKIQNDVPLLCEGWIDERRASLRGSW